MLDNDEDVKCYERIVATQDWSSDECKFQTQTYGPDRSAWLDTNAEEIHIGVQSLSDLKPRSVIIDNTPFPGGIIQMFEPVSLYVTKENDYQAKDLYFQLTYTLILISSILLIGIIGVSVKLCRVRKQLKDEIAVWKQSTRSSSDYGKKTNNT